LTLLKRHLGPNFADFDAKFRMELMSRTRELFKRLRGGIFVLERSLRRAEASAAKNAGALSLPPGANDRQPTEATAIFKTNLISLPETQLRRSLQEHEEFLRWYLDFLRSELVVTASYQRHVSALKATLSILRMEADEAKPWAAARDEAIFYSHFDLKWVRSLLDLVLDPFDDVRDFSAAILKVLFSDQGFSSLFDTKADRTAEIEACLAEFFSRASRIAQNTGRADKADGVARSSELLHHLLPHSRREELLTRIIRALDDKLSLAGQDLGAAVLEAPVHGDFSSLW
jgi:hypothetical protein